MTSDIMIFNYAANIQKNLFLWHFFYNLVTYVYYIIKHRMLIIANNHTLLTIGIHVTSLLFKNCQFL